MKKNLLVTLADKNYVDQAKQLFSSVYFNAGWKGDYMLLSHEIPEKKLKWFREKGILVKKCKPLYNGYVGGMPATLTSKLYLFTTELKQWDNIIYLDADIIVRASLDELTKIKGFAAVPLQWNSGLSYLIVDFKSRKKRGIDEKNFSKIFSTIKEKYNLRQRGFCDGFMAFSTDIIEKDTFSKLNTALKKYGEISRRGEQLAFNLFFYKKWRKLPYIYNFFLCFSGSILGIESSKIKGIILHFAGIRLDNKPRVTKDYFYKEWKHNLKRAELIDLNKIQPGKKWSKLRIQSYCLYLKWRYLYYRVRHLYQGVRHKIRYFYQKFYQKSKEIAYMIAYLPDRILGLFGVFLKRRSPGLYFKLKMVKKF